MENKDIKEIIVDNPELERIRVLRCVYDQAIRVCDPVKYKLRQQELLHAIAEYLIQPLQEHEMAERSKFDQAEDSGLTFQLNESHVKSLRPILDAERKKEDIIFHEMCTLTLGHFMKNEHKCEPLHDLHENESEVE